MNSKTAEALINYIEARLEAFDYSNIVGPDGYFETPPRKVKENLELARKALLESAKQEESK